MSDLHKVVVLARGLGTRMRKAAEGAELSGAQAEAASHGAKAMMPIGRPFLDHCLNAYADAGITEACLVIGPEHQNVRDYYDSLETKRIKVSYAVQEEPLGTANAVLAAEEWVGADRFVMVNGDNYYPTEAVRALGETEGNATIGFDSDALVANSNIPADRIAAFAILRADENGDFADIIEKPAPEVVAAQPKPILVSMNCFCFTPEIFESAKRIEPSARGEYEIVDAVRDLVQRGLRVEIVRSESGVLDMSNQNDIKAVEKVLKGREVEL